MDKLEFVYRVNGLRDFESAVKSLYRLGIDVGQDESLTKKSCFCTFKAVDMQTVFHSCCVFWAFSMRLEGRLQRTCCVFSRRQVLVCVRTGAHPVIRGERDASRMASSRSLVWPGSGQPARVLRDGVFNLFSVDTVCRHRGGPRTSSYAFSSFS